MNHIDDTVYVEAMDFWEKIKNKGGIDDNAEILCDERGYYIKDSPWNYDKDDMPATFGYIYFEDFVEYSEEWGEIIWDKVMG